MSIDSLQRTVNRKREEIAKLSTDKAREQKKIADLSSKIQSATRSMQSSKSASTIQSKLREISRYENDKANVEKKIADYDHKIAQKNKELTSEQRRLADEEARESKKRQREQETNLRNQTQMMNRVTRTLHQHASAITTLQSLPEKITVLFFASNPRGENIDQLSLDEEVRSIEDMIRKSKHRESVKLESRWAVRPGDILQAMNELEPTIVHFSGHGSDNDELVLMDNQQQVKLVSLEAIVQAMSVANDNLKLVFFNTCFSYKQASCIVEHIDSAIGMNTSISDDAARIFSSQFYSAIGFGFSVEKAFNQAKAALMLESIPEDQTPKLYVKDGIDAKELCIVAKEESNPLTYPSRFQSQLY